MFFLVNLCAIQQSSNSSSAQEKPMQLSAELRWFWKDTPPDGLLHWFCGSDGHKFVAGGGKHYRVDRYLKESHQPELGIKSRDERVGTAGLAVEVKGLIVPVLTTLEIPPFIGAIQLWTKWTSKALARFEFTEQKFCHHREATMAAEILISAALLQTLS
jgi:hypothetical protein